MQPAQSNLPLLTCKPTQSNGALSKTLHPLGALLLHSLPQLLLLALWAWMLLSYESSLAAAAKPFFYLSFSILLLGWLVNLGAILYHFLAGISLSLSWTVASLFLYLAVLVVYYLNLDQYDTLGVPSWQQPGDILYYTGSFLLPAILHLLTLLAVRFSHRNNSSRSWGTAALALVPPIICYLVIMGAFNLRTHVNFDEYWVVLLGVTATVSSIFLLILGAVRIAGAARPGSTTTVVLKILLTALAPLGCLLVNNGGLIGSSGHGIFGDFHHPLFYILAVVNGLLISLPVEKQHLRPWAFLGRCILLPFSLYFFFVIAPFMPLSIFLAIFLGLGLLLLVPVAVLGFHLQALVKDVQQLRTAYAPATLGLAAAMAFLVLPAGIYLTYQHDRVVLHRALDYLEDPTATTADVSTFSLARTLDHVDGNKDRNTGWFDGRRTPLLSPWFTRQVLDGLNLSDKKVAEIELVFLNKPLPNNDRRFTGWGRPDNGAVALTALTGSSTYDATKAYWVSQVALEMHNPSQGWEEYITEFKLPEGSWVSDYYLYLGDVKEAGMLVERKAAMWVYDQITRTRKDPGLLRYLPNGMLELRVYPFTGEQSRKTGFTLLHKRPFTLHLDGKALQLGEVGASPTPEFAKTATGVYIPAELKAKLPKVERRGYWHFVLDCSEDKKQQLPKYKAYIQQLLKQHPDLARGAKVSFTGHSVQTHSLALDELDAQWEAQTFKGGFYLERAFQQLLLSQYKSSEQGFPVPVVISDNFENALLPATLLDIAFALPAHGQYYRVNKGGTISAYSLAYPHQEAAAPVAPTSTLTALAWPNADSPQLYLPDNGEDAVLPLPVQGVQAREGTENAWHKGLQLWTLAQGASLYPNQHAWLEQVKASFAAHILSPHTAFMVVEEAWQRDMLLEKQAQYLNGHPGLDSDTELEKMPEPEFWVLLLLLGTWLWWRRRKAGIAYRALAGEDI